MANHFTINRLYDSTIKIRDIRLFFHRYVIPIKETCSRTILTDAFNENPFSSDNESVTKRWKNRCNES